MIWYEHGDVTIKPINILPATATKLDHRVLRVGRSGHKHVATGAGVCLYRAETGLVLYAPTGAEIGHEEHEHKTILPGIYAIGAQREYDHFAEEAREIVD